MSSNSYIHKYIQLIIPVPDIILTIFCIGKYFLVPSLMFPVLPLKSYIKASYNSTSIENNFRKD